MKTLGQIAFEKYWGLHGIESVMKWETLASEFKEIWEQVAICVAEAIVKGMNDPEEKTSPELSVTL